MLRQPDSDATLGRAASRLTRIIEPHPVGRLRRKLAIEHPLDFNRDFDSLIFITGTGRSGTTWLVQLLNADNRHRVIFEPLRRKWGALGDLSLPAYLRPDFDDPLVVQQVGNILCGRCKSNRWTGRANRRMVSWRRIVKEVDSNLRLAWLRARFPSFPIILIIRHPLAVAASRERLKDKRTLDRLLADPLLVEDHLGPFVDRLQRLGTQVELEVANWCIENGIALRQLRGQPDVGVVFYEHLVMNPPAAMKRLFEALGRMPPRLGGEKLAEPSLTAYRGDRPLRWAAEALTEWRSNLTTRQIGRGLELVGMFGLDALYGPGIEPLPTSGLDLLYGDANVARL